MTTTADLPDLTYLLLLTLLQMSVNSVGFCHWENQTSMPQLRLCRRPELG